METLFDQFDINDINKQRVFCDIGYDADCPPSARMASLVDEYMDYSRNLIDLQYSYVIKDIVLVHKPHAILEDSVVFESEIIARLLERCPKVAVFTLTIGSYLEETAQQLSRDGFVLQASVLDAIGSGLTEKLADVLQAEISEVVGADRFYTSRRFSPGYCDWDVSQQKMVFKAMNENHAGVSLTGECLMIPRKSVSGIIGIGPPDAGDYNPCTTCDKENCIGRR